MADQAYILLHRGFQGFEFLHLLNPSSMSRSPMPSSLKVSMANMVLLLLPFALNIVYSKVKVDFLSNLTPPPIRITW